MNDLPPEIFGEYLKWRKTNSPQQDPVFQKKYRLSDEDMEEVKNWYDDLLNKS